MDHRIIDQQLDVLRDKILLLGGATESAVQRAMQSLVERDSDLAKEVLEEDKIIDQMELEIDRLSIEILALQHPAAHDLRFVISVAKITPILERIADHAGGIAEAALIINIEPLVKNYVDFPIMAQTATEIGLEEEVATRPSPVGPDELALDPDFIQMELLRSPDASDEDEDA